MKKTLVSTTLALLAIASAHGADLRCGGVGSDERRELSAQVVDSNLALELFIAPGGEYIADVAVELRPLESQAPIFSVRTDGPICYLSVPPGRYRIQATFEGVTRSAQVTAQSPGRKPARVALAFPKSVGDKQTDAASPEEKQQAAKIP